MKTLQNIGKCIAILAFGWLAAGCATGLQSKEDLAAEAGFKIITPTKADQKEILAKLPPGKVTHVSYKGKSYYVLPDASHSRA